EPVAGPGVNEDACAARREGGANLPAEHLRLSRFTVPQAVQTHLRHDQGAVAGNVVQAGQVGIETLLRFQINVETGKIEERKLKIFGGGIIDVGDKTFRILRLHGIIKACEEAFQSASPIDRKSVV